MGKDKIILVGDDPYIVCTVSQQLESAGFAVARATSGTEATKRLDSERYDLIITDLFLDRPNGLEWLEHARLKLPDAAVIILTGFDGIQAAIEALRLGVDDYLLKPSEPQEMLFHVRNCIARCRLQYFNDELERRVAERTATLVRANKGLTEKIERQKRAQTALSRSLEEKEVLLREVQHRVRNNLATISGLINLQDGMSKGKGVDGIVNSLKQRVQAIHLVYENASDDRDLSLVNYRVYVESLVNSVYLLTSASPQEVRTDIDVEDIWLDIDTSIPLGLITTELLSNAYTHAFPHGKAGTVRVCLVKRTTELRLSVSDDGIGLPAEISLESGRTLGFRLVTSLAAQLEGSVELCGEKGTTVRVRIPLGEER